MGLLDGIVGGMLGGDSSPGGGSGSGGEVLMRILMQMLASPQGGGGIGGGLGALVEQLQRGGLGDAAASWISTGANLPVRGEQLQDALGGDFIARIAQQLGASHEDTLGHLTQVLPQFVDRLTPQGRLPDASAGDAGQLGDLIGSMLKG